MNDRDCENCKHHTKKGCKSWDCNFERKVTRKETIKVFEDMKKGLYPFDPTVYLDIAINSLEIDERYELEYEQIEPCEDAISRQAVLDILFKYTLGESRIAEELKDLPSVNPQEPMVEIDLYSVIKQKYIERDVLDKIRAEIIELRSHQNVGVLECLDIIDKYRAESEE